MKVRRYTGTTLEKIRETIVRELGENAVIVSVKKSDQDVSKGLFGIGKKKKSVYEVTAAADEPLNVDDLKQGTPLKEAFDSQKEQYRGIRNSMKLLDEKLADVNECVEKLSKRSSMVSFSGNVPKYLENIHPELRPVLMEEVSKIAKPGGEPTGEDWHEALAAHLNTAGGVMFRKTPSSAPDVYVVVGPTGVGKTTTMAKLAAKCVLGEKLNVGLVSTDTFRVGAVDQLREYASLLGVELAVAFTAQELASQLERFMSKDVVFIDTPGRGPFDDSGIKSIKDMLDGVKFICTLLVVQASVKPEDAAAVVAAYSKLSPAALILSKTDEASRCDGITKLLETANIPVVYLTDGQRVPEDIHAASPGIVASLVMPSVKCGESIKIGEGLK